MVSKPLISPKEKPSEDDKAGDNEVEECACVPREVSFRLPRNFGQPKATQKWVSLLLTRYSGQPLATMNWGGQP